MKHELLTNTDAFSAMNAQIDQKSVRTIDSDLFAGRFIKAATRSDRLWVTYRATSKTSGDWYVWDGIVHTHVPEELDDRLVTGFLDAMTEARKNSNEAFARAQGIFKASALYSTLAALAEKEKKDAPGFWDLNEGQLELVPGLADARKVYEIASRRVIVSPKDLDYWHSTPGINRLKERVRQELRVHAGYFADNRNYVVMNNGWCYHVDDLNTALAPSHERPVIRHLNVGLEVGNNESKSWLDLIRIGESMDTPKWQAWLDEFVPEKADQAYLQEACGAALLGKGKARNIVHLVGPPATGKSTFLNIMEMIFGRKSQSGYAGTLSKEAIVKKNGSNFMQAEARDVRFLKLSEPSTDRTDDSFLKNLSGGGEAIVTEKKNQNPEEWNAECVLFVAANSVLRFATWDPALVDRLNIVHFATRVRHIDPDFDERLVEQEGPGILSWVLDGAERYSRQGSIYVPQIIKDRAEANVVDSSNALRWLRESEKFYADRSGDVVVSQCVPLSDAFKDYQEWCFDSGEKARTKRLFTEDVHRYTNLPDGKSTKSNGARLYGVLHRTPGDRSAEDFDEFNSIMKDGF